METESICMSKKNVMGEAHDGKHARYCALGVSLYSYDRTVLVKTPFAYKLLNVHSTSTCNVPYDTD